VEEKAVTKEELKRMADSIETGTRSLYANGVKLSMTRIQIAGVLYAWANRLRDAAQILLDKADRVDLAAFDVTKGGAS